MDEKKVVDVALEEYRVLWRYYEVLVGEWNRFVDAYLKVVTLPASVVGFFAVQSQVNLGLSQSVRTNIIVAALALISLVGIGLFIGYAKECRNGVNYEKALTKIREFIRIKVPDISEYVIIDDLRKHRLKFYIPGNINFWRGTPMILVNSAIGTSSISIFFSIEGFVYWSLIFIAFVAIHIMFYISIQRGSSVNSIQQNKNRT